MERDVFFSFRKGDWLAVLLVAATALAVALAYLPGGGSGESGVVQIYQDGALVRELSLQEDAQAVVSGEYVNTIVVKDGRVCFEQSDCPGTDCVHSGWISAPGRSLVCLPNRVEIRIAGQADVDFVVG